MKIGGIDPKTLSSIETLVLPKGEAFLVFKAQGLPNLDEFHKLCPEPNPPQVLTKDGWSGNEKDKNYQSMLMEHLRRRLAYLIVKSLEPTEIEWETVDMNVPGTWANWEADMKNNGLSQVECNLVIGLVLGANSLDENKIKRAREVFLQGPPPGLLQFTSPTSEPSTSPPGEPVVG